MHTYHKYHIFLTKTLLFLLQFTVIEWTFHSVNKFGFRKLLLSIILQFFTWRDPPGKIRSTFKNKIIHMVFDSQNNVILWSFTSNSYIQFIWCRFWKKPNSFTLFGKRRRSHGFSEISFYIRTTKFIIFIWAPDQKVLFYWNYLKTIKFALYLQLQNATYDQNIGQLSIFNLNDLQPQQVVLLSQDMFAGYDQKEALIPHSKLSRIKAHKLLNETGKTRSANEIFYDKCMKQIRNPLLCSTLEIERFFPFFFSAIVCIVHIRTLMR